jgi:hypothetical protein
VSVARSELPRLTEGWRAMLLAHEPDERGDCPTCSTRWHRCKAPCSVWQVAHEHLVAGGLAPQQAPRRQGRRKNNPLPSQTRGAGAPTAAETTGRHALVATPRGAVVGA